MSRRTTGERAPETGANAVLPGSRPAAPPAGFHQYLIQFATPSEESAHSRAAFLGAREAAARTALAGVQEAIRDWGLEAQVISFGEPTPFLLQPITCTDGVARKIETLPSVEAVFRDTGFLQMTR